MAKRGLGGEESTFFPLQVTPEGGLGVESEGGRGAAAADVIHAALNSHRLIHQLKQVFTVQSLAENVFKSFK